MLKYTGTVVGEWVVFQDNIRVCRSGLTQLCSIWLGQNDSVTVYLTQFPFKGYCEARLSFIDNFISIGCRRELLLAHTYNAIASRFRHGPFYFKVIKL